MPKKHLTDKFVETVKKPAKGRVEYFDASFGGLALRVTETGHKSWVLFYRQYGRLCRHTFPTLMKPKDARQAAAGVLNKVQAGIDPMAEKRALREEPRPTFETFESALGDYLTDKKARANPRTKKIMKDSTWRELKRSLERDVSKNGKFKSLPLAGITKQQIKKLTDSIAAAGNGVHANRIHARLRAFFNWCVGDDRLKVSPMHGLTAPSEENERERVLTADEIRWFWKACGEVGWPFGPIGQLLLLTAQRRSEVGDLDWSEIDRPQALWTIPGARTKNRLTHKVHLSTGALRVLDALPQPYRGRLFSMAGERSVSGWSRAKDRIHTAMVKVRRRELGLPEDDDGLRRSLRLASTTPLPVEIPHWTLHDLRRTATTKMAEELKVAPHVADAVLNHASGTIRGVAKIYNRAEYLEESRAALEAWSNWVAERTGGAPAVTRSNVINLPR